MYVGGGEKVNKEQKNVCGLTLPEGKEGREKDEKKKKKKNCTHIFLVLFLNIQVYSPQPHKNYRSVFVTLNRQC